MEILSALGLTATAAPEPGPAGARAADPFLALLAGLMQPATPPVPVTPGAAATAVALDAGATPAGPSVPPPSPPANLVATAAAPDAPLAGDAGQPGRPPAEAVAEPDRPAANAAPAAATVPEVLSLLAPTGEPAPRPGARAPVPPLPDEPTPEPDAPAPADPRAPAHAAAGCPTDPALSSDQDLPAPPGEDRSPVPLRAPPAVAAEAEPDPPASRTTVHADPGTATPAIEPGPAVATAPAQAAAAPDAAQVRALPPVVLPTPDPRGRPVTLRLELVEGDHGSRVRIALEPADLGRVEVALRLDDAGTAAASFTVDRPETLQLLQRDARVVNEMLSAAGFTLDQSGLDFTLRDPGGRGAGDGERRPGAGGRDGRGSDGGSGDVPAPSRRQRPGLLDLRV